MKRCKECGETKALAAFHRNSRMKDGRLNSCSKCRRYRCEPQNAEKKRARQLKSLYGITLEQYDSLLKLQNGYCAICQRPETRRLRGKVRPLAVDHDHETGRVRGLLCGHCNSGIGYFKENPRLLKVAAGYCLFGGFDGNPQEI